MAPGRVARAPLPGTFPRRGLRRLAPGASARASGPCEAAAPSVAMVQVLSDWAFELGRMRSNDAPAHDGVPDLTVVMRAATRPRTFGAASRYCATSCSGGGASR